MNDTAATPALDAVIRVGCGRSTCEWPACSVRVSCRVGMAEPIKTALSAALADTPEVIEAMAVERCLREQRRHRKRLEDPLRSPYEETAPGCQLWMRWSDEVRGDLAALRQLFLR